MKYNRSMKAAGTPRRSGGRQPAFVLDALSGNVSGAGSITNTRASAQTVTDHEGIYRQAKNNELCWDGLRRVENLFINSSTFTGWSVVSTAIAANAAEIDPYGRTGTVINAICQTTASDPRIYYTQTSLPGGGSVAGRRFSVSFWVKGTGSSVGKTARLYVHGSTGTEQLTQLDYVLTSSWTRICVSVSFTSARTSTGITGRLDYIDVSPVQNDIVHVSCPLMEETTGASTSAPSECDFDSAAAHNAVAVGVKYFATTNGNTVAGSGVVTEANGTAISNTWTGLSLPQTQINYKTYSEDMDAADWTLTNATAPDDGTLGPDAVGQLQKFTDNATNSVHTLYGSASGGTTGTMHTMCFHVKAGTLYGVVLRVGSDIDYGQAEFRFSDMTIVSTASLGTGTFRNAWIERVGLTDTYRIIVCATFSGAILGQAKVLAAQSAGVTSYVGTSQYCYIGFAGLYIGHDSPGPYIPNKSTGTTTRAINAPSGNLPAMFASNGNITMVVKFKPFFHTAATWKQEWYDNFRIGNSSDMIRSFYADKSSSSYIAQKFVSSVGTTVNGPAGTQVRLQQVAVVSGLVNNVHKMSVDGTAVVTSANSDACPNAATFGCGDAHGIIQRVEFWPRAMSGSEMRARSTP